MIASLFGVTTPGRPFTDHPQGTAKAVRFELPPQFGAVAAAAGPLCIEQRQICVKRALPHSEHIASIASKHLTDKTSTVAGFANDLFDRHTVPGEGENRRIDLFAS